MNINCCQLSRARSFQFRLLSITYSVFPCYNTIDNSYINIIPAGFSMELSRTYCFSIYKQRSSKVSTRRPAMNLFISYGHGDYPAFIERLVSDLRKEHKVWVDHELRAGDVWSFEIELAIDRCDNFIFIIGPMAVLSLIHI